MSSLLFGIIYTPTISFVNIVLIYTQKEVRSGHQWVHIKFRAPNFLDFEYKGYFSEHFSKH